MKTQAEKKSNLLPANQSMFAPHRIALMIMWIVTTVALIIFLFQGLRNTDQFQLIRYLLQAGYVLTLLWFLWLNGPSVKQLPEIKPAIFPKKSIGKYIPAIIIVVLFVLTIISDDGHSIILLLLILATLWMLIIWWREIKLKMLIQGFVVGLMAFLAGYSFLSNNFASEQVVFVLPALVPLMYIAGCLMIKRTGLGGVKLLDGKVWNAIKSFLFGCLLFIPLGLINAADGSPGGNLEWVNQIWMPPVLPFFSGIAEETLYRLLLISLVFFLLRPAFPKQPAIAIIAVIIFSAIIFGLGHGRNLDRFLTTGLLYGLPMAVIFVRRDWEHSVGAHYMVNMIPWLMAFLES